MDTVVINCHGWPSYLHGMLQLYRADRWQNWISFASETLLCALKYVVLVITVSEHIYIEPWRTFKQCFATWLSIWWKRYTCSVFHDIDIISISVLWLLPVLILQFVLYLLLSYNWNNCLKNIVKMFNSMWNVRFYVS